MANQTTELSYSGQEVRKYDNDRFLTCLFAPADRREHLFALYAFNLEVAKTREVVSEPLLGQMRLQWWRDSVAAVYGEGTLPQHEVVRPLAEAVAAHGLTRRHFDTLIDAREADLDDEPPASLDCLVNYAEATAAPLVRLALEVLGTGGDTETGAEAGAEAARHAGIAHALTGILRAVPFHARQGRVMLPADRLAAHDVRPRDVMGRAKEPGVRAVIGEVAAVAREHLAAARAQRRSVPRAALPALLPATLAGAHLDVIARADHDVLAPRVLMPNPFRPARLAWAAFRGRY
ncbi:phytoene/squalene synthase family protein [Azospirillum sp.]|uniref:phytoene/squalene synthase family protein n=1 Tax=Azospirillum sp. TaxID=34012 RepID=UPI002D69E7C0|nr:phytoene/squalene synthase family protein [Azospirillum sp.]HYD71312.1 phytoene/squalene synthase family protein [Azospirillum sp.]